MKTTIEIEDALYRRLKAHAAMSGQSVKALLEQALREKLQRESAEEASGWRQVFGKVSRTAVDPIDRAIQGEFETIDPEDWK